jgi:ACS family hexuronate transporter-like MFS transporter
MGAVARQDTVLVLVRNSPQRETLNAWLPAGAMMLVSVLSYVDRNTLALLAPTILKDTHMSVAAYGWVVSAYSVLFTIGNPLWGKILDRFGLRRGMTAAVSLWTLASASHAWAGGFAGFAAARAALGLGEGAASPGGLRTVVQTLPDSSRSRGMALTFSGGSAGAILTPFLMTPVAEAWGWHAAFWFTGLLGALWVSGWLVLSGRPDVRKIEPPQNQKHDPHRPRLNDRRFWAYLLAYSLGALPLGFVVYSASIYLSRVLGLSQRSIGTVLWLPPLGSEIGVFFWGWLADRMARGRLSRLAVVRRLLPVTMLLSLALAATGWTRSFPVVMTHLFFAMFVAAAFQILPLIYGTEIFSRAYAGYLGGVASGAYGAGLAVLMPLFGRLFDLRQYNLAFSVAALCPVFGYLAWRMLCAPDAGIIAEKTASNAKA